MKFGQISTNILVLRILRLDCHNSLNLLRAGVKNGPELEVKYSNSLGATPLQTLASTMSVVRREKNGRTQRLRRIVFTLNNYSEEEYTYLRDVFAPTTKWFIMGKETGANGTPHLQGASILGTQTSFSTLKTLTGFRRAHLEPMAGKPEDSLAYCRKEDSHAFEHGTLPTPGKRNDVHAAVERVLGGESLRSMAKDVDGGVAIVKFHKGLTVLRSLARPARTDPPKVFWLYGSTGTGKTRCAFKAGRVLARSDDVWIFSGGLRWFDGYDGQPVAIFDDFRSKHVANFAFLLRLLDRYPMDVEFKGGFVKWVPSYIFITCPYDPDECFATRKTHVPEDIAQLRRRITSVVRFTHSLDKGERRSFVDDVLGLCGIDRADLARDGLGEVVPMDEGGDPEIGAPQQEEEESEAFDNDEFLS